MSHFYTEDQISLRDTAHAWTLQPDDTWRRVTPTQGAAECTQETLMQQTLRAPRSAGL